MLRCQFLGDPVGPVAAAIFDNQDFSAVILGLQELENLLQCVGQPAFLVMGRNNNGEKRGCQRMSGIKVENDDKADEHANFDQGHPYQ